MKTFIIEQKQSNSGSIHDIADSDCDRAINFPKGCEYAVVLSSYYGGKGYTVHKTEGAAINKSLKMKEYSHEIIDAEGNFYTVSPSGDLVVR